MFYTVSSLVILESHKVVGQLIQSLQTVGLSAPDNRDLHLKIVQLAREVNMYLHSLNLTVKRQIIHFWKVCYGYFP